MRMSGKRVYNVVTAVVAVATVIATVWIMAGHVGLVDELDFGAGAYYYADIPDFDKLINEDAYVTSVPYWVHVALFVGWGFLMYRLWVWVDSRPKK